MKRGKISRRGWGTIILVLALCAMPFANSCGRANPPAFVVTNQQLSLATLGVKQILVVDDGANLTETVGQYASLAFDSSNNPHIAYYDFSNGSLKYAERVGGVFTTEVVDAGGDVGMYASLRLDRDNNPHIAYYGKSHYELRYARRIGSGSPWEIFVLDNPGTIFGHPGSWASLAVGINSGSQLPSINISYIEQYYHSLRYLRWVGVGRPEYTPAVDTGIAEGYSSAIGGVINGKTSIALDYNENPFILYYDASNANLRIARQILASQEVSYDYWKLEQVKKVRTHEVLSFSTASPHQAKLEFPSTQNKSETIISQMTGAFQAVNVLNRNEYHYVDQQTIEIIDGVYRSDYEYSISYPREDVNFAKSTGGEFLSSIYYERDWDEGFWNDLVIDPAAGGPFHICYYNADLGDLNYGTWIRDDTLPNKGFWTLESVERGGVVGSYCSISLLKPTAEASYSPVIGYFDTSRQMLRFASRTTGEWVPYLVDTRFTDNQNRTFGTRAGAWSNLKVAPDGTIGVTFQDIDHDVLLYAEIQYP